MQTISEFMTSDHHACDESFAAAEEAALADNWAEAETLFHTFHLEMAKHFRMEENELFPELLRFGGPAGPVQVMLMEHTQMKGLIEQMSAALARRDAKGYGGLSETLLIVMQQHNLKEEQILYPMANHYLAIQREALFERMQMA